MGTISSIKVIHIKREFLPKQMEVFSALKRAKFILYSGAFRAGKTLLLANIAIRTCIANPGCVGLLGSLTYPQLRDVVFTVFKQEAELYQKALDNAGIQHTIIKKFISSPGQMRAEFTNGSLVHFKACDDELKLRGYTLDFFGLDEPIDIDETIFTQLVGRISGNVLKKPFGILTTNPGSESHWIYRRFFVSKNPQYATVKTTTYDNELLPDYNNYIKSLLENFDDDWVKRFLNGDWGAFAGQIYKNFDTKKHVGDYKKNKDILYYIAGVDFGTRNPSCVLTIGITKNKRAMIVNEYYAPSTSSDLAKKIQELHEHYNYRKVFIDPAALDLITQCEQLKIPAEAGINKVEPGIAKIKSMLQRNLILIDKFCGNLISEMLAYHFERDKLNNNPTEKPSKVNDHACDALRYALFSFKLWKGSIIAGYVKRTLWEI